MSHLICTVSGIAFSKLGLLDQAGARVAVPASVVQLVRRPAPVRLSFLLLLLLLLLLSFLDAFIPPFIPLSFCLVFSSSPHLARTIVHASRMFLIH